VHVRWRIPITVAGADAYRLRMVGPGGRDCHRRVITGFPLVQRVPVRGQWMESAVRPFPGDRSWCRGRFTVSVAYANAERVFAAFGQATFVVGRQGSRSRT
jgi:hypothetical protein